VNQVETKGYSFGIGWLAEKVYSLGKNSGYRSLITKREAGKAGGIPVKAKAQKDWISSE
jgi:hypothetical protein